MDGKIKHRVKTLRNSLAIALKMGDAPEFGQYLPQRLDALYKAYRAGKQT